MDVSKHLTRGIIAVLAAGSLTMIGVSAAGGTPSVHRQTTTTVDQPEANDAPDTPDTPEANDTPDTADTPEANDQREQPGGQEKQDVGTTQDPED
jgi:hypothetical protein